MTKKFTLEDKKRFNGAIEHVEDINSNANAKSAFVDVDEKLLISEGEDKVRMTVTYLTVRLTSII